MKQRTVTACIGLVLFFVILFWFNTIVYDIAICIVSLIAVHELLLATKVTKNISLTAAFMIGSVMPFLYPFRLTDGHSKVLFWYIWGALLFIIAIIAIVINMISKKKISLKQHVFGFLTIIILPSLFYILLLIRNEFGHYQGLYYTMLIFACSWGADTGAYFAGRSFGKRKLAPKISPNKTVEGVYGGVISALLFVSIITAIYYFFMKSQGQVVSINYWGLLLIGIFGSLAGVLGDLTASTVKRQCEIKDFGSIMPGHGGILDRFDSVLFVAPFIFIMLKIISI